MIPVPEADVFGARWSGRWRGVPMHLTLLYPFLPPERLDEKVVAALRALLEPAPALAFTLAGVCGFPAGVTYLAPRPGEPFVRLTHTIWERWPEHPPYEGRFESIVPHVTIPEDEPDLERIAALLPLPAEAREALLLVEGSDGWTTRARFRFSG